MKTHFFSNAPRSEVLSALKRIKGTVKTLRQSIKEALKGFDLIIGQGNRPDRMHTNLIEGKIIEKFDYYFSGSKTGVENIATNWFEREVIEGTNEHIPYIWDSPQMWVEFFALLNKNRDKKILVTSSAPRNEHKKILDYPNVLFTSPFAETAVLFGDDKRHMSDIYESLGMPYDVCNYEKSEDVSNNYAFHVNRLNSQILVVQASRGSGGVTKNDNQALFFIENENEFQNAIKSLIGEGPLRVMKKYEGVPSNTSALALPFGTYVSGIPSIKPCGITEIGARPGTSGGNQWDTRFPAYAIDSQFEQIQKVGTKMAASEYYGVFGLDPIMPLDLNEIVFNSEINARSQGPDPQRALAAMKLGIPTLEEMQLAFYLGCPKELFPSADDYNLVTRWLRIPPYLKLFPKEDYIVKRNFNGYWNWDKTLIASDKKNASFKICGAPYVGQKILKKSPDNFLYIKFFNDDVKIFTDGSKPHLTDFALEIIDYLYANI